MQYIYEIPQNATCVPVSGVAQQFFFGDAHSTDATPLHIGLFNKKLTMTTVTRQ